MSLLRLTFSDFLKKRREEKGAVSPFSCECEREECESCASQVSCLLCYVKPSHVLINVMKKVLSKDDFKSCVELYLSDFSDIRDSGTMYLVRGDTTIFFINTLVCYFKETRKQTWSDTKARFLSDIDHFLSVSMSETRDMYNVAMAEIYISKGDSVDTRVLGTYHLLRRLTTAIVSIHDNYLSKWAVLLLSKHVKKLFPRCDDKFKFRFSLLDKGAFDVENIIENLSSGDRFPFSPCSLYSYFHRHEVTKKICDQYGAQMEWTEDAVFQIESEDFLGRSSHPNRDAWTLFDLSSPVPAYMVLCCHRMRKSIRQWSRDGILTTRYTGFGTESFAKWLFSICSSEYDPNSECRCDSCLSLCEYYSKYSMSLTVMECMSIFVCYDSVRWSAYSCGATRKSLINSIGMGYPFYSNENIIYKL